MNADPPPYAVACLKAAGARSVWRVERPGEPPRTIKTWPRAGLIRLKHLVGRSQPHRHRAAAARLDQAGVHTPRIHALRIGAPPRDHLFELELEFIDGVPADDALTSPRLTDDQRQAGAAAIGDLVAALIRADLFNRDLKLSNLVLEFDVADDPPRVWLIDPVGVRTLRDPTRETARMLERLGVEPLVLNLPFTPVMTTRLVRRALAPLTRDQRRAALALLRAHPPH